MYVLICIGLPFLSTEFFKEYAPIKNRAQVNRKCVYTKSDHIKIEHR